VTAGDLALDTTAIANAINTGGAAAMLTARALNIAFGD
jgi:hypothetical protein